MSSPPTPAAIRTIVEEVLRRIATESRPLQAGSSAPSAAAPTSAAPASAALVQAPPAAITARVVTLDVVSRLPSGVRQVTVPPGAVIT
ncbi:MAG: hypothetical protein ACKOTB_10925, partial [Planctomycetia bacterium]